MKTIVTFSGGKDKSTYYLGAFLANPFPLQDGERERKTTVTSGRICYALYGKSDPLGSLVKTLLESLQWYSPARKLKWVAQPLFLAKVIQIRKYTGNTLSKQYVETLNARDIQSNRYLFRLVPSARHTAGIGCGLLPTVQTQGLKLCNSQGKTKFMPLNLLPTPKAQDCRHALRDRGKSNLGEEMSEWAYRQTGKISQLNPLFVAEMMGFPLDWTVLPFQSGDKKP
jgi:hypothetical protein